MGEASAPTLDPAVFDRNLSALRRTDPQLAEQLTRLTTPADRRPVPAVARDGSPTFRLTGPDGGLEWFGRTSIPSVRAAALVDRFDTGQANVLLPGLGEGSEAHLLIQRLGRHRAIFVWEEDPAAIRLMLQLHDVADAMADERLLFLVCPPVDLTRTLLRWLEGHSGHLCPDRLMMWPWQSLAEVGPCRTAVEAAYQQIERERGQALAEMAARRVAPPATETAEPPAGDREAPPRAVALLALHAGDETWSLTDALARGASALGWRPITIDVRTPGDMHPLARARRLADAPCGPPDFAILLNLARHQVRDTLPETVPAVCWLGSRTAVNADPAGGNTRDPVAVMNSSLLARAVACGIDERRVCVCPPPCLADLGPEDADTDGERPVDVALFADVGPVDAASLGLGLPAYAEIWKVAVDLLSARLETFAADQAETLLARAESKMKSRIDEPRLRREVVETLAGRAAESLLMRLIAQTLSGKGFTFHIHGEGWSSLAGAVIGQAARTVDRRARLMRRAKVVVHADVTGQRTGDALLAAGSGAVLVARTHPDDAAPGGLRTLLRPGHEMLVFTRPGELVGHVRRLLDDAGYRRAMAGQARRRCRSEHTPAARLAALRAAARSLSGHS